MLTPDQTKRIAGIDMQKIMADAPPIGFKKDQFTPFGKWLVDSDARDAHVARQVAWQVLDAVWKNRNNGTLLFVIDALRAQIEGGDHA